MEYGLHECIPLYSGGLGILAADHLKSASDLGVPLTGIGILWREGYYTQEITPGGDTRALYPRTDFERIPARDTGLEIAVPIGRRAVRARIWKVVVGRVDLYLLDTDLPSNRPADRALTSRLYGGDNEHRIRQEALLGVGGVLLLEAVGIEATVHHLNEGHAAFAGLERLRRLIEDGWEWDEAVAEVRASSVFTTHTPVPAGNDRFDTRLFDRYMSAYAGALGLSKRELHALGREDEGDLAEPFCMTVLALKLADRCNGVARLHGETSRKMWMRTFGAKTPGRVPIGHITNGVHPETWIADEARPLYDRRLRPRWVGAGPDDDWWKNAKRIPAGELWALRQTLRRKMITELRTRLRDQLVFHHEDQSRVNELFEVLDEDALTIGFARRFAPYKRAPLVFRDPKRLAAILNDADRPVQIIYAGKAHPADLPGQEYVRKVMSFVNRAPFRGRVWLLQNYDTSIGRLLTQGCDLWLNNPIRPMEASGTSGMKPPLNGGLNLSILDGWWPEGYNGRNGWVIGSASEKGSRAQRDRADAESIYERLENEVVPAFYDRDRHGVPRRWVRMMAESMRSICGEFSSHRMVADYVEDAYWPANG
jgi:starch phosphorylase